MSPSGALAAPQSLAGNLRAPRRASGRVLHAGVPQRSCRRHRGLDQSNPEELKRHVTETTAAAGQQEAPTRNEKLRAWVEEVAELTQPDAIHWCDGSAEEYDRLA